MRQTDKMLGDFFRGIARGFVGASLVLACAAMMYATPAAAQTLASVDFTPVANNLINFLAVVATVAGGVVSKFLIDFLSAKVGLANQQMQQVAAERVNEILYKSISYAEAWAKAQVADPNSPIKEVRFDNFFIEQAVKYAMHAMPAGDKLATLFKLTPERIAALIRSRLNNIMPMPEVDSGKIPAEANFVPVL